MTKSVLPKSTVEARLDNIIINMEAPTARITFNRPSKRNPLDWDTVRSLIDLLEKIEASHDIEMVVFSGVGKAFSAGGDLASYTGLIKSPERFRSYLFDFNRLLNRIEKSELIFIAAVQGYCVAGGLELVLACDFCLAAEEAQFSDGHLNFGIIPGSGSSQRLPRAVGSLRAKEMILTDRFISGREAAQIGLANTCVPLSDLEQAISALIAKLSEKSFVGRKYSKYLVNEGLNGSLERGLQMEMEYCHKYVTTNPDAIEGLTAFIEKRRPRFQARRDLCSDGDKHH
jgi:enoyl-CoA hydratase